jgi:hypothetical protein
MNQAAAEALTAGQKILYWDGRVATITQAATVPVALPPPLMSDGIPEISLNFDQDPDPKSVYVVKSNDFMRAEPM